MKTAIVVCFERLPLGWLGCYGRSPSLTPNLDRFAANSVVFDRHFAENTAPDAANHAWWTGRHQFPLPLSEQQRQPPTFFDLLTNGGVDVTAICESTLQSVPLPNAGVAWRKLPGTPGSQTLFREALELIKNSSDKAGPHRLLWILSSEIRGSEVERPATWEQRIREIDAHFGRFVQSLHDHCDATGTELLVLITADTGMPHGGLRSDQTSDRLPDRFGRLADCVVKTPLIVHTGNSAGGLRQSSLVQSIDLPATILEWFGFAPGAAAIEGQSLLPLLSPDVANVGREFVCFGDAVRAVGIRTHEFCLMTPWAEGEPPSAAEADSGTGFLVPPDVRLFVKPDDAWEVHNVAEQEPDSVQRLLGRLREFLTQRS